MRIIYFLFCIIFFITSSFAQEVKKPRWNFYVCYGLGIPVGRFHKISPEKSVFNSPPTMYIDGFDKEGNGAAKVGQFQSFNVGYNLMDHWLLLVEGYKNVNLSI